MVCDQFPDVSRSGVHLGSDDHLISPSLLTAGTDHGMSIFRMYTDIYMYSIQYVYENCIPGRRGDVVDGGRSARSKGSLSASRGNIFSLTQQVPARG